MFSLTLLLAFSQLIVSAVGNNQFQSPYRAALEPVKRGEYVAQATSCTVITVCSTQTSSTLLTTTTRASTTTTTQTATKTSATPSCATSGFKLKVNPGNSFNFYVINNVTTNQFITTTNLTAASTFYFAGSSGLITLNPPLRLASVVNTTGAAGNPIISQVGGGTTPLAAAFDQNCNILLSKKISDTVTLDTIYALSGQPQQLYIQPKSRPAPSGSQLIPFLIQVFS